MRDWEKFWNHAGNCQRSDNDMIICCSQYNVLPVDWLVDQPVDWLNAVLSLSFLRALASATSMKGAVPCPLGVWCWVKKGWGHATGLISAFCFLQCFNTWLVAWQEGHTVCKKAVPLILKGSLLAQSEEETEGNLLSQVYLEHRAVKMVV